MSLLIKRTGPETRLSIGPFPEISFKEGQTVDLETVMPAGQFSDSQRQNVAEDLLGRHGFEKGGEVAAVEEKAPVPDPESEQQQ